MKTKRKTIDILLNILLTLCIVISVVLIVFKLTFVKVTVSGISMNPSIDSGAHGYMIKVNKNSKINRFDVVASWYEDQNEYIIKRVLGLPNEKVILKDNVLYVNDQEIEQTFNFIEKDSNFSETSWTLKDNQYLLVGDNRQKTMRPVVVSIEDIFGKNGFSYGTYDDNSDKCNSDGKFCPVIDSKWYLFKEGK